MDHQQTRPEKRICELDDKSREIIHSETQREKEILKNMNSIIKWTSICIIGALGGNERMRQKK